MGEPLRTQQWSSMIIFLMWCMKRKKYICSIKLKNEKTILWKVFYVKESAKDKNKLKCRYDER